MDLSKGGHKINSIENWFEIAPPKGRERHWQDGRSAKECAKAWLETGRPALPVELRDLFDSNEHTQGFDPLEVEPEAQIKFDKRSGEPCNADLAILGSIRLSHIGCTIEAKVNEHFGKLLPDELCSSLERWRKSNRSRKLNRIKDLVQSILPAHSSSLPLLTEIRYQLLTAVAGTLAWANWLHCCQAVLVIHEFRTLQSTPNRIAANAADLNNFVRRLTNNLVSSVPDGEMLGPFQVPGTPLFNNPPPLFIGKAVRHLASADDINSASVAIPAHDCTRSMMLD